MTLQRVCIIMGKVTLLRVCIITGKVTLLRVCIIMGKSDFTKSIYYIQTGLELNFIFSIPEPKAPVSNGHSAPSVVRPSVCRPSGVNFHIFDFSSETAERNSTKLDRKQDLNALYQVCVFRADQKNKMAALASDWLRHFRLLL